MSTDYKAIMDEAAARGDYVTAAKAEIERNKKIDSQGLNYEKTNLYGGYQTLINDAVKKSNFSGAKDYENQRNDYIDRTGSGYAKTYNFNSPNTFSYDVDAPTYQSKYDNRINQAVGQHLNRAPFSYDPQSDPKYQQYSEIYERNANRAMEDTMGKSAAMSGGVPSSYSQTAAQQEYQRYMDALSDKSIELEQQAYDRYLNQRNQDLADISLLQGLEDSNYNRYLNALNQYNNDRQNALNSWYYTKQLDDADASRADSNRYNDALLRQRDEELAVQNQQYQDNLAAQNKATAWDEAAKRFEIQGVIKTQEDADILGMPVGTRWPTASSSGGSSAVDKDLLKLQGDIAVSDYLYSPGKTIDQVISDLYNTEYVNSLRESLISYGYTLPQADEWIVNARATAEEKKDSGTGYTGATR